MRIDIGQTLSYGNSLDQIIGWSGQGGTEEIQLRYQGVDSAKFHMQKSDLYLTEYENNGAWIVFAVNYNDMKSPSEISASSVAQAIAASSAWGPNASGAEFEKTLKLLIFVISEAARFMPVRFAVQRAMNQAHKFTYGDFEDIIHKWDALKTAIAQNEGKPRQLIRVADVQKYLKDLKPSWAGSLAEKHLLDAQILF